MSENNLHEIKRLSDEIERLKDEINFLDWLADNALADDRVGDYLSFDQESLELMYVLGKTEREYMALIHEDQR